MHDKRIEEEKEIHDIKNVYTLDIEMKRVQRKTC